MTGKVRAALSAVVVALAVGACDARQDETAAATTAATAVTAAPASTAASSVAEAPVPASNDNAPGTTRPRLALSPDGLDLVDANSGSTRHLGFGSDATALIEILTRVRGTAPERGQNDECSAGPLEFAHWKDGLSVNLQEGKFVGWWVDQGEPAADAAAPLTTIGGIGLGATRTELEAVHAAELAETTLGTEFAAGELFGLLESAKPDARITAIWAGTSCVFR